MALTTTVLLVLAWKPFEPLYVVRKKSLYSEEWSFQTVNQQRALCITAEDDYMKHEFENLHGLSHQNPLDMDDIFFAGVELTSELLTDVWLNLEK